MQLRSISGQRHQRGFTLIELMVTVTLTAVMLAIGVPSFRSFVATQRVKSTSFDVAAALLLARSEAVKRNRPVTVTPVGGAWTSGWTVQDGATVLMQQEALLSMTVTGPASLIYLANGRISAAGSVELASTTNATAVRCVKVDLTGIPATTTGACS